MKKLLFKIWLLLVPFVVIAIIVIIIDPYNYFLKENFISDNVKFEVINRSAKSMPRGNTLWKMIDFKRSPAENIIIGDSRAYDLNVDTIKKISGLDIYNFGIPGGNYNSIIKTFWYICKFLKPERVYIQVGFHNYSSSSVYDLVNDAQNVMKKPYLFFTRFYFFGESMLDVYYSIFRKPDQKKNSGFDQENWNSVIENQGKSYLSTMKYPSAYYDELGKISEYCRKNNIELAFIIFPDNQDFHDLVSAYSLDDEYNQYKKDIQSLSTVYDFDTQDSEISKDRNNYRDIYHLNINLINSYILPQIWNNNIPY